VNINASGYRALIGCSVAIFWPGAFIFSFPGVMAPYWQDTFDVGKGAVGNLLFFVLAALGIFMFFVGRWQEKIGHRNMITVGVILCSLNCLMLPFVPNIFGLYLWAFLNGASSCFVYIPSLTMVQRWFPARRGLVSGVVNLVFGLSAAIMTPVFTYLFLSLGYVVMAMVLGFTSLITGTIATRWTNPPVAQAADSPHPPDALGMAVDNSLTPSEALRSLSFWCLWLVWAFQGASGIAMVTLSTSFGLSRGFQLVEAVVILTIFNLASGISRLISGYVSDLVGRNITMSVTFVAAGLSYFLMPWFEDLFIISLCAGFVGFAFGTLFAVSAPLAVDCFGMKHFGSIFGLMFTSYGFVSGLAGPTLAGYLLDFTAGNFPLVFGYLGFFCLAAGLLIRYVVPPENVLVSTTQ